MFDLKNVTRARNVAEAVTLLTENPGTRLIAGGTDVLIKLRHGRTEFAELVDIHGLKELDYIRMDGDRNLLIGSGVVFTGLMESSLIREHVPILIESAESVGGPQIRNVATMGGNICNGVPSADSAPSLFVLNARVMIQGRGGYRETPITDFFKGPGKVDLNRGDVLTGFKIAPENYDGFRGTYFKYAMRNAMDIATIGCGVSLKASSGTMDDFRICFGVAGPVPMRCPATEAMAKGKPVSKDLVAAIADTVEDDVNPRTSWRASGEFRINIIRELAKRATVKALERAGEKVEWQTQY